MLQKVVQSKYVDELDHWIVDYRTNEGSSLRDS